MNHKYLKDIGIENSNLPWNWNKGDPRKDSWKKERNEFGFDERDTWNLNYTLTLIVYERLKHYREIAPINMDSYGLSYMYEIDGDPVPYGRIIDRILLSFESRLKKSDLKMTEEEMKEFEKSWELLGKIYWSLWW